ncbi:hypothetical protein PPROV_000790100 [Pycnococcus provasolii]|uniref:Glutamyl-tRNA(Gln) amidotransferase subunit A, chloroplastic/mitochondrial n=1 Tax=Pycnococcus provasolii TaxID=41880 RepID=A0A830HPR1_9CHLO|nr:hypothetical protein PPROV_000790100 [Pycnococcus provasolii]
MTSVARSALRLNAKDGKPARWGRTRSRTLVNALPSPTSALESASQVTAAKVTSVQLTQQALDAIAEHEDLGAFLHVNADVAINHARQIDERSESDDSAEDRPLLGVPIAVKDNLCTSDMPTTAGSKVLENYTPPYDATAVQNLRKAGAVIVGKTNLDEFGMGSTNEASAYHVVRNPWATDRVPGGSSGGSAAAVAANLVAAAIGTDTGGSIRQPASFCGIVGFKPTYGLVSRYGLISYASSLDTVGCLARSVDDAEAVLMAMAGGDASDATSSYHRDDANNTGGGDMESTRFALVGAALGEGVDSGVSAAVRAAAATLESLGATCDGDVDVPNFEDALPAYYAIACSEASSNLSRFDGARYGPRASVEKGASLQSMYDETRGSNLGEEVKRRILMGTYALSSGYYDACYKRAQQVRTLVRRGLDEALEGRTCLLLPAAPTVAYKLGEKTDDPLAMYAGDLMTVPASLAGLPAVVIPCGMADAGDGTMMPVGLQLIGKSFSERELARVAKALEKAIAFKGL